jgi:hypothetical protein
VRRMQRSWAQESRDLAVRRRARRTRAPVRSSPVRRPCHDQLPGSAPPARLACGWPCLRFPGWARVGQVPHPARVSGSDDAVPVVVLQVFVTKEVFGHAGARRQAAMCARSTHRSPEQQSARGRRTVRPHLHDHPVRESRAAHLKLRSGRAVAQPQRKQPSRDVSAGCASVREVP